MSNRHGLGSFEMHPGEGGATALDVRGIARPKGVERAQGPMLRNHTVYNGSVCLNIWLSAMLIADSLSLSRRRLDDEVAAL